MILLKKTIFSLMIFGCCQSFATAEGVNFTGVIEPAHDVQLSFPIDGVVAKTFVDEGDVVRKGMPLLRLDDRLQKLETQRRKLIWRNRSRLDAEMNKQDIVRDLLQSTRALYRDTGSISEDEVKRLEIQTANILGEVNELKEENKKQKVEFDISNAVLYRHTLRSPIDGMVTDVFIENGEWVRTGKEVIRIVGSTTFFLEVSMDEKYAHQLKKGMLLDVQVKDQRLKNGGKVEFVSPVADPASSLVRVKVRFVDVTGVVPGISANVYVNIQDEFVGNPAAKP